MVKIVEKAHNPKIYAMLNDIITVQQASKKYGYHQRTIAQWCDLGYIAAVKLENKRWIISETSLKIFLQVARNRQNSIL